MAAAMARARASPASAPPHRTRTTRNGRLVAAMAMRVRRAASGTDSSSMPWTSRSNGSRKYRTPTSMTGVSVRSTSTAATRNGSAVASHARGRPTARSARRSAVGGVSSSCAVGARRRRARRPPRRLPGLGRRPLATLGLGVVASTSGAAASRRRAPQPARRASARRRSASTGAASGAAGSAQSGSVVGCCLRSVLVHARPRCDGDRRPVQPVAATSRSAGMTSRP